MVLPGKPSLKSTQASLLAFARAKGFGDRDLDMHGHSTRARQSVRRIVEVSPTLFNVQ
jgi:hypothetical protein